MNTKGIKFLAVLAVLAMAFAACAVLVNAQQDDAATGDAKSPLDDGSVPYESASVKIGTLTFTPYLQPQTTISGSNNAYTLYGTFVGKGAAYSGNVWNGVGFSDWAAGTKILSFGITGGSAEADAYYYVYQENAALPEKAKLTPIKGATADLNPKTGDNPSFEILVPAANETATLKLIRSDSTLDPSSAADVKKAKDMAAGDNCVIYTITMSGTTITDSNAVSYGFYVKDVTTTTPAYYNSLRTAVSAKAGTSADNPAKFEILASHDSLALTWDGEGNKFISVDFKGNTVNVVSAVGSTGTVTQALRVLNGSFFEMKNGTLTSNCQSVIQMMHLYGTFKADKMTFDGSKIKGQDVSLEPTVKSASHTICAENGVVEIKNSTIIGSATKTHNYALVIDEYKSGSYNGVKVTLDTVDIQGDIVYGAESATIPDGAKEWTTTIKDVTLDGNIKIDELNKTIGWNGGAATGITQVNLNALCEKMTITSLTVKEGKKMELSTNFTDRYVTVNVANDGKVVNNGSIDVKSKAIFSFKVNTDATKSIDTFGLQGTGKVNVADGGILILNNGKAGDETGIWTMGQNEVTINKGGAFYAVSTSSEYWSIVGSAASTETPKSGTFPTAAGAAIFFPSATGSKVIIQPEFTSYPSSLKGSTYTFVGPVTLGKSNTDAGFDWFARHDNAVVSSGTITLTQTTVINENVTFTLNAGAIIASATTNELTVKGHVKLADSSQYYSGIKLSGGDVKVEGEGGSSETEVKEVETGTTIDSKTFDDAKADVIVTKTSGIKDVTVPTGKALVIENVPATTALLDVSADNSEVTVNTGNDPASYAVTTGGDNKIYLENVKGSLTFKKGSVEIDISQWKGGEIKLDKGADVKIFGNATTAASLTISMKTAGDKATLTIDKDSQVEIVFSAASQKFEVGEGIDFKVNGKLIVKGDSSDHKAYGNLTTNDKVTVNGTVDVSGSFIAAEAMDVYGTLKGTVTASEDVVAYGTSDINAATITIGKLSGKDKNGGIWTYDAATDTLTVSDYNGNYNFTQFVKTDDKIAKIVVKGENKITYKATTSYAGGILFGHATSALTEIKTVQGTGSLEIVVDLSKAKGENLDEQLTVIKAAGEKLKLDAVNVSIIVSGDNAEWTANETKAMKIVGIEAPALDMYNSGLGIDIMKSYKIDTVKYAEAIATGVVSVGTISVEDSHVLIATAGEAMTGTEVTIKSSAVTLGAKLDALTVGANDIKISNSTVDILGEKSISSKDVEIKNSSVTFEGDAVVNKMDISSGSLVNVTDMLTAKTLILSQASNIEVKDLYLLSTGVGDHKSVNDGTITVKGAAVILGTLDNNASLINDGAVGVYGTLNNYEPGLFTNNGEFAVYSKEATSELVKSFEIVGDAPHSDDSKARLRTIPISTVGTNYSVNADGSITVKNITPTFSMKDGFGTIKDGDKFEGTILPSQDDDSYVLVITNGTATISVVYNADSTESATLGGKYTVTVSGVLVNEDDETKVVYLEANKSDKTVTPTDKIPEIFGVSGAGLSIASGNVVSTGTAVLFTSEPDFLAKDGSFAGDLKVQFTPVTLNGSFAGDLVVNGTGLLTINKVFTGEVVSKGSVTLSKDASMLGNIVAEGTVTIAGEIVGNVEIDLKAPNTAKLVVSGDMLGDFTYVSKYKANKDDTTDTESTSKMSIGAEMTQTSGTKTFEINLAAAANATTSTAGTPGYFTFGSTMEAPAVGNNVSIVLKEGMLKVPSTVIVPERFEIVIEKDTTIEVVKGATLDVKKSALKVSKDAIAHFETGTVAVTYGLVGCIMSFEIESGAYTIYSDVAYALTICDEGAELTVNTSADIADNVAVKKGVNVIIADKVTLDFKTFGLEMADDAKITLMGTGKLVFGQTGEDKTDDTAWEFFTINGTIVYDGNAIVLDDVRFDAAGAEFTGVAATASAGSKLSTKLNYSEGTVKVSAGIGSGSVALGNGSYPLQKGADDTLVFATFIVGTDAVFDASSITDAFCVVDYKKEGEDMIIDKYVLMPTVVGVEGTLNLANTTYMKGAYAGLGVIKLAAGKEFILDKADEKPAVTTANVKIPGTAAVKIVDTTEFENGYVLNLVSASPNATVAFKATTQKIGAETFNVMTIGGDVGEGIITATNDAFLDTVTIQEDAAIVAEDAFIIGNSKAIGFVGAKEIYMKEGTATSEFKTLDYQISFEKEDYTFYGYFATVDFEEVSDIAINGSFDLVSHDEVVGLLPAGTKKVDLSGKDVSITVAEGKALTINVPLIIGTPINALGAGEGSSLVGKFVIDKVADPNQVYLVVYSDVDLTLAEIYQDDGKTAAVYSMLDIDDIPYAAIFANEDDVVLAEVDKKLVPEIEGYTFAMWVNYNRGAEWVGETNAYADFKAVLITITVKYVEGVDYYMDGLLFQVFDTPTDVKYGSYFTAKISDTSKYQGNPMINGVKTYTVEGPDTLVATGVAPIPEPPQPEPEPVIGDSGISLTDILLIVLVVLIAIMVVILVLRLNRS